MKSLKYICAQHRLLYYAWQVEVMLNNFLKFDINPNDINVLVACNTKSSKNNIIPWGKLIKNYKDVNFFFYQDTRQQPIHYISSIRPNIIKQHFLAHPELRNEAIFYHDCDIVFTKKPDFQDFINDDTWYLSNTNSYINHDYIISKGEDIYKKMCQIVGIDEKIPQIMNNESGGAQYILKNTDFEFWNKVEKDSENLYYEISKINVEKKKENTNYHELQIWCADMWAVLWNAWLRGFKTKIDRRLDFSWAADTISQWEKTLIYHNSGAVSSSKKVFYKGDYINKLPYNINAKDYIEDMCSYNYVKEILYTSSRSCLI